MSGALSPGIEISTPSSPNEQLNKMVNFQLFSLLSTVEKPKLNEMAWKKGVT